MAMERRRPFADEAVAELRGVGIAWQSGSEAEQRSLGELPGL
ncbi:MAG: hypothetical protein AB1730_07375 [Myxococcota bacterium]|jgi:hypothetical protein